MLHIFLLSPIIKFSIHSLLLHNNEIIYLVVIYFLRRKYLTVHHTTQIFLQLKKESHKLMLLLLYKMRIRLLLQCLKCLPNYFPGQICHDIQ